MRKNFITREYQEIDVPGTVIMREQTSGLSGKMMRVADTIRISEGLTQLYTTKPVKSVDQTSSELLDNTKWEFTLDSKGLLENYLYNKLTLPGNDFVDVIPTSTATGRVQDSISSYIKENLLKLYKLGSVNMWTSYYDISQNKVIIDTLTYNVLQYKPVYVPGIKPITDDAYKLTDKVFITEKNGGTFQIVYKQNKSSKFFTYFYYLEYDFIRA